MLLIRPMLYLVLFFFIMQLDAYLYLIGAMALAPVKQVLFATILVVGLYIFSISSHISVRFSKESIVLLFCFLLYLSIQILGLTAWGAMPDRTIVLVFWIYMIVLLLLGAILGTMIGNRIPYILFSLLVILVAVIVADFLFGGISESETWGRPAATLRNPNVAASVVVMLMLGSLRWQRVGVIEILSVIIAGAGIALTESRGGMLAYLVVVICYGIWWGRMGRTSDVRAKRYLAAGFFSMFIFFIATAVLFARRYGSDGMENVLSVALSDPNARDEAIKIALELIIEKPLFGHGTGFVYTQQLGPHNMILRAWVENGFLGLLGILMLFLGLLWVGVVRKDSSIITLAAVLFTFSMTTHNLTEARSVLIVIGILLANSSRRKVVNRPLKVVHHNKRCAVIF